MARSDFVSNVGAPFGPASICFRIDGFAWDTSHARRPSTHRDIQFVLYDVLKADEVYKKRGLANVDRDLITALLGECSKFSEEVLAPLNVVGDRVGAKHDPSTNTVTTPPGFKVRQPDRRIDATKLTRVLRRKPTRSMPRQAGRAYRCAALDMSVPALVADVDSHGRCRKSSAARGCRCPSA